MVIKDIVKGFELYTKINHGVKANVYKGKRLSDNISVVVKTLVSEFPTEKEFERFRHEYRIGSNFDNDHIIKYFSLEKSSIGLVIILENFDGIALKRVIPSSGFSLSEFLEMAIQIAEGLEVIHAKDVIHRDINPNNILINIITKTVKIIDFGVSIVQQNIVDTKDINTEFAGTLAYISPEQTGMINRSLDYRTDFYSLGVTFYELLANKYPYDIKDPSELVHSHIAKMPISLIKVRPDIPIIVSEIIEKLMSKDPDDRYQSATAIKYDLKKCLEEINRTGRIKSFELGKNDFNRKDFIHNKFYGRKKELNLIKQKSKIMKSGGKEVVLVHGAAGVGKTSFLNEITCSNLCNSCYFMKASLVEFKRNMPYHAVISAFNSFIDFILTKNMDEVNKWKDFFLSTFDKYTSIMLKISPKLERIIGEQAPVEFIALSDRQNIFDIVFRKIIKNILNFGRGLVVFFDDFQWIDHESLELLLSIFNDKGIGSFICIGTCQDVINDNNIFFKNFVDNLTKLGIKYDSFELSGLEEEDVIDLLSDVLLSSEEKCTELAKVVKNKTGGNPFFINELLKTLFREKYVTFDKVWDWNIDDIKKVEITERIANLLLERVKRLPAETFRILEIASCFGLSFNAGDLAKVSKISKKNISSVLSSAFSNNIIEKSKKIILFSNTRIRDFFYESIDEKAKLEYHHKIAKVLLKSRNTNIINDDLLYHLDFCSPKDIPARDRIEYARLNYRAGLNAKYSYMYDAALEHIKKTIEFLPHDKWISEYEFTFSAYYHLSELSYIQGDFDKSENICKVLLKQARSSFDKAKVLKIELIHAIHAGNLEEAVLLGLEALDLLGEKMSNSRSWIFVLKDYLFINMKFGRRISRKPRSKNDVKTLEEDLVLKICLHLGYALKLTGNRRFLILSMLKIIKFSFRSKNVSKTVLGIVILYMANDLVFNGINNNPKYINFIYKLVNRYGNLDFSSEINFLYLLYIYPWHNNLKDLRALTIGYVQSIPYRGYIYMLDFAIITLFYSDNEMNLDDVLDDDRKYFEILRDTEYSNAIELFECIYHYHLNLKGRVGEAGILKSSLSKERYMLINMKKEHFIFGVALFSLLKFQLYFLFEDYFNASYYLKELENASSALRGFFYYFNFIFYSVIFFTSLYPNASQKEKIELHRKIKKYYRYIKDWHKKCPDNFSAYKVLVEAELDSINNKRYKAEKKYDEAIDLFAEERNLKYLGLAYELAAKHYIREGLIKIAGTYMRDAVYYYHQLGANAKVSQLQEKYSDYTYLGSLVDMYNESFDSAIFSANDFYERDLDTVLRGAQAISEEITLEKLLPKIMKVILENAGADKGFIILNKDGTLEIKAHVLFRVNEFYEEKSDVFERSNELSKSIVQYVIRTGENVIFSKNNKLELFKNDPYINDKRPASILCTPISYKEKILGALYLENSVTSDTFTERRLLVLKSLITQAAISLENANLYSELAEHRDNLEELVNKRTSALEDAHNKLILAVDTANEAEEKYRSLIENSPDYILTIDQNYIIKFINRTRDGDDSSNIVGQACLEFIHSDYRKECKDAIDQCFKDGERLVLEAKMLFEEEDIWFRIRLVLVLNKDKETEVLIIATDITEHRRAEDELDKTNKRLVEAARLAGRAEVAIGVLHNVGNVLNSIGVTTETVKERIVNSPVTELIRLSELLNKHEKDMSSFLESKQGQKMPNFLIEISKYFQKLRNVQLKSLEDLTRHINHISDIITLQQASSRLVSHKEFVSVEQIITEAIKINAHSIEHHGIKLEIESPDKIEAFFDRHKILQILTNLISNAKFAVINNNSTDKKIKIFVKKIETGKVEIKIEDNGLGILKSNLSKIFFHGFTTKKHGHGFGLHNCANVAKEMNGDLIAHSDGRGKGAVFTLIIPYNVNEDESVN